MPSSLFNVASVEAGLGWSGCGNDMLKTLSQKPTSEWTNDEYKLARGYADDSDAQSYFSGSLSSQASKALLDGVTAYKDNRRNEQARATIAEMDKRATLSPADHGKLVESAYWGSEFNVASMRAGLGFTDVANVQTDKLKMLSQKKSSEWTTDEYKLVRGYADDSHAQKYFSGRLPSGASKALIDGAKAYQNSPRNGRALAAIAEADRMDKVYL
jgi:hypothetical protein